MSAADRDYWREPEPNGPRLGFDLPPVSRALFFTLIGCFAAQAVNEVYGKPEALGWLALTTLGISKGWAWQLITFQFLHAGLMHLFGNLLAVWFFGAAVERILGARRFLIAYFGAGIAGGLLQALLMVAFPGLYGPIVVGASAGLEGLFAIFVLIHRDAFINLFLVLPVRAIHLYYVVAAISVFFTVVPSGLGGGIAHAAHLGGLMFGTLWVRQNWHHDYQPLPGSAWVEWIAERFRRSTPNSRQPSRAHRIKNDEKRSPRWESAPVKPEKATKRLQMSDISSEADPILDKIAQHGMHSLTASERQKLDEVRRKMTGS